VAGERTYGRLPVLLVALTAVSGVVDAFSFLELGHVFVATITGSVLLLGFALAGAGGISLTGILVALVSFAVGVLLGGRLVVPRATRLLVTATAIQAVIVAGAAGAALTPTLRVGSPRHALVAALAVAMGLQNAVAHRFAVPDMSTTVVSMPIVGLIADSTKSPVRRRRLVAARGLHTSDVSAVPAAPSPGQTGENTAERR
jgi:uncharacterized membrane protein YoaK (UPF0700 family)